ncbi:MAG: hypothetical protein KDE27_28820 [Planctomycetes bacterium]|nr:hypothetical protein [Planctomycetota bacterium]
MLPVSIAAALAAACQSAPLPDGEGRGVLAFDPDPPPGAATYELPTFRVGDRYALLRGGRMRLDFAIVAVGPDGVVVQDATGHQLRRTPELAYLGNWNERGEPVRLVSPADTRFHWPLWVGKTWRCEFVDRRAGAPPLVIEVRYRVEAAERITVPAGTFDTLRIARIERAMVEGEQFFDQTSLVWYAPSVGLEVRQLIGGTAFELVEWTRGPVGNEGGEPGRH